MYVDAASVMDKPTTDSGAFSPRDLVRQLRLLKERILWGGDVREQVLRRLLEQHYESLFRRLWVYGGEEPHFTNHRIGAFRFGFSFESNGPEYFYRGFFSSELLRRSDRVLDIGCGDGFFTKRFFSVRCESVDAVDIEPSAIEEANRYNGAPNVNYLLLDAVNQPFPRAPYDVVVWDGALGHFARHDTETMFRKIKAALAPGGVFTGSESMGREGHDHLQFFESLDDLAALLRAFWKHVQLRDVSYPINRGTFIRREGYWRCSDAPDRLEQAGWRSF
jgi:SAM-dependent methyltransferase